MLVLLKKSYMYMHASMGAERGGGGGEEANVAFTLNLPPLRKKPRRRVYVQTSIWHSHNQPEIHHHRRHSYLC